MKVQDVLVETINILMGCTLVIQLILRENTCIGLYLSIVYTSTKGTIQIWANFESTRGKDGIRRALRSGLVYALEIGTFSKYVLALGFEQKSKRDKKKR